MQIKVDPQYPMQALDDVQVQLKMPTCLLSQGGQEGINLDDFALAGMCALLAACTGCIAEVGQMAGDLLAPRKMG